jgi:LytS/YehU family sensor histidine kinase
MKRGTISYFVKVALAIGAVFALVAFVMALSRTHGQAWQTELANALAIGAFVGVLIAVSATYEALRALEGAELRAEDIRGLVVRQWTEVELPLGLFDSLQLVEQALRTRRGVTSISTDADHKVTARVSGNFLTPGEVIAVTLSPVGKLAAVTTRAMIESRPVWPMTLMARKSRANVQAIALTLNQEVNKHLQAQREAAALQAQLHQARLGLLQAQVEPHFLYNTLAHLQLLIRSDACAADEMAGDLIGYLRLSMPDFRGADFTLGRELELVRAYLALMKIRLRDRLHVRIESNEEAGRLAFPALLLHTLVENSIKHGIEPRPEGGTISIAIERTHDAADMLKITVADTGIGLQSGQEGSGVGLANLRERLELLYKGRARFTVAENTPSGVVCTLEIPCAQPRPT